MPKHRANNKKAAPSTAQLDQSAQDSRPLFEIDTQGSSTVRHQLNADQGPAGSRLRKGQSFKKPLRSDLILAQRSSEPALTSRVVPSADAQAKRVKERLGKVDRATKDKLRRLAGKDGQGEGLRGVKTGDKGEAVENVKDAGRYDAWAAAQKKAVDEDEDAAMQEILTNNHPKTKPAPKAPATLAKHAILEAAQHRAISIPHPGSSYNPSHEHHQALLASALEHCTAAELRDERGSAAKDAMDASRVSARGLETWEAYEEEVGSGESDAELQIVDPEAHAHKELLKRRAARRKTTKQRTTATRVAAEAHALAERRAMKKRIASVQHVRALDGGITAAENLSLEEKALALRARKVRLAERGLTRFRSGPSRVPDAPVSFQLGDELADNLRTLQPEGNLWKEWVNSGMRRGRVPVERANEGKKGGKRGGRGHDKGHSYKEVEKFSYKNWTG
ncbi:hypothetical protein JCM10450v2_000214 [Rhodotorula kratochvilovae]